MAPEAWQAEGREEGREEGEEEMTDEKGDGNMGSYSQRLQLEVVFQWDDAKYTIESIEVMNDPAPLDPGQQLALAGALIQQAKDWVETTGVTGVGKDTSDERDDEEAQ